MTTAPLFLAGDWPLTPGDAVAAILTSPDGRYLMQHRDAEPRIFFPDLWCCFGGGTEAGEQPVSALTRELEEELGLPAAMFDDIAYFTDLTLDYGFSGGPVTHRRYFTVTLPDGAFDRIQLGEGQNFGLFAPPELFQLRLTPYDCFVLWAHHCRDRFAWPA